MKDANNRDSFKPRRPSARMSTFTILSCLLLGTLFVVGKIPGDRARYISEYWDRATTEAVSQRMALADFEFLVRSRVDPEGWSKETDGSYGAMDKEAPNFIITQVRFTITVRTNSKGRVVSVRVRQLASGP